MIDLHCHSTASDGSDTPSELIKLANKIGLKAIALTDHDVINGLEEFQNEAKNYPNLLAINASELGAMHPYADMEVIAMNIKDIAPYQIRQKKLIDARNDTHIRRIEILNSMGMDISFEDICIDENGNKRTLIGKPHLVNALLDKGHIDDKEYAYKKLLAKGCPAYVEKQDPSYADTISFIRQTGAIAILAHPIHTKVEDSKLFDYIKDMKDKGLQGIEVFHSDHSQKDMIKYLEIAQELNLIVSGGSDYHGQQAHPGVDLGFGKGKLNTPDILLEPIVENMPLSKAYYQEISKYI